jgi:hypothetical protein
LRVGAWVILGFAVGRGQDGIEGIYRVRCWVLRRMGDGWRIYTVVYVHVTICHQLSTHCPEACRSDATPLNNFPICHGTIELLQEWMLGLTVHALEAAERPV